MKESAALGETYEEVFLDRSSILLASAKVFAGRTQEEVIIIFPYGIVLVKAIVSRL